MAAQDTGAGHGDPDAGISVGIHRDRPAVVVQLQGEARFYVRIAQEHFERKADGSFIQGETTLYGLVMFRRTAERAFQMFANGDSFVAEGYVRSSTAERDGQTLAGEEFVAKRLGQDTARTSYAIDRERRRMQTVHALPTPNRSTGSSTRVPTRRPLELQHFQQEAERGQPPDMWNVGVETWNM